MEFGYVGPFRTGPTLGTLEAEIMQDEALAWSDRMAALQKLRLDVGPVPRSTPLRAILRKLGGGILGYLVAKYFGMSPTAQALSALAGYSIGSTINDFYRGYER